MPKNVTLCALIFYPGKNVDFFFTDSALNDTINYGISTPTIIAILFVMFCVTFNCFFSVTIIIVETLLK